MKPRWLYPTESNGLQVRWGDGWIEAFPEHEFAEDCDGRPRKILMYRRRRRRSFERCESEYSLTVHARIAKLDYAGRFAKRNSEPDRDFYMGQTEITFTDETRSIVRRVRWRDEGEARFKDWGIEFSWRKPTTDEKSPFVIPKRGKKKRIPVLGVLRPGQLRFRSKILDLYGGKCCISGFDVPESLEAAHIVPYEGRSWDHVQNGLLVRADLHRLFDCHLLSIHPVRRTVHLSRRLKRTAAYSELEGVKIHLPHARKSQPSRQALEHHWRNFKTGAR